MGLGDEIMATGLARGLRARGLRAAFGDGHRIIWSPEAHLIFRDNPNIARPGDENSPDLRWIHHYKGCRLYHLASKIGRWQFNPKFKAEPGEIFFSEKEKEFAASVGGGFVIIEPNVKSVATNKQWPKDRYAEIASRLRQDGHDVRSFDYGGRVKSDYPQIKTPDFRHALAVLKNARLYIGPEGGLHHGAAAVSTPAVVIFGGFISPKTTGYDAHTNIFVGGEACGMMKPCDHCREAMASITTERVYDEARNWLGLP
jgi:ADP-heptose:LPS heptosyltransferase